MSGHVRYGVSKGDGAWAGPQVFSVRHRGFLFGGRQARWRWIGERHKVGWILYEATMGTNRYLRETPMYLETAAKRDRVALCFTGRQTGRRGDTAGQADLPKNRCMTAQVLGSYYFRSSWPDRRAPGLLLPCSFRPVLRFLAQVTCSTRCSWVMCSYQA